MANEKTIAAKQAKVDELANELKEAKAVLLTDYRGITVTDVTKLRADLRNVNAEYKVIKNNIVKRALDANGESALDEALEGPVALVIGKEDYLEPSKTIYEFTKNNEYYKIKGGVIEGRLSDAAYVSAIAQLPNKEGCVSMLLSVLQAPMRNLAYSLGQIAEKK